MYVIVSGDWHPIHSGPGSPLSRKASVSQEWPIQQWLRTTWSCRPPVWICGGFLTDGWMSCNLLMLSSHLCYHLALMYVAISGFRVGHQTWCNITFFSLISAFVFSDAGMAQRPAQLDIISGSLFLVQQQPAGKKTNSSRRHSLCSWSPQCSPMQGRVFVLPLWKSSSDEEERERQRHREGERGGRER